MQGALPRGDRIVKQNAEKCLICVKLAITMAGIQFLKILLILLAPGHYTAPISPESYSPLDLYSWLRRNKTTADN